MNWSVNVSYSGVSACGEVGLQCFQIFVAGRGAYEGALVGRNTVLTKVKW